MKTQKFKTRQEIANEYHITPRTLYNKLKKAKIELPTGNISPKHQQLIYDYFGKPQKQ